MAKKYTEIMCKAHEVKEGDIVFPVACSFPTCEVPVCPFVASRDAFQCTPIQNCVWVRDEQSLDHLYPAKMTVKVVRPDDEEKV